MGNNCEAVAKKAYKPNNNSHNNDVAMNSLYEHKGHKRNIIKQFSRSSTKTTYIANMKYHCDKKDGAIYDIDWDMKDIIKMPCGCDKRRDVNIDDYHHNEENMQMICLKHDMLFVGYCFECEIRLCSKCKEMFHNDYFKDHHIFILKC